MAISALSDDEIWLIADFFTTERDANALSQTSRRMHRVVNRFLYRRHVQRHDGWALTWAARSDRLDTAKLLIAAGAGEGLGCGYSPLVEAVVRGNLAMVELLLSVEGLDPNTKDAGGFTPLGEATKRADLGIMKLLLADPRVDPNKPNAWGFTPLAKACLDSQPVVVERLLREPRVDPTLLVPIGIPLIAAAATVHTPNLDVLRLLLADPRLDPATPSADRSPALCLAATAGQASNFALLLEQGLDVNGRDRLSFGPEAVGRTPLLIAASAGNVEKVAMLLARDDVDVNATGAQGWTPLNAAVASSMNEVVRLLLADERVDPNIRSQDRLTPLLRAITNLDASLVKILLGSKKVGASSWVTSEEEEIPDVEEFGWGAFSFAASLGDEPVVRLLYEDGRFPLDTVDRYRRNAMSYAAEMGSLEVVELLLEIEEREGVAWDVVDKWGSNPIGWAKMNGHEEVVELLLKRGYKSA